MARPTNNADVGKRVREARIAAGLSQPQLGEIVGVTAQAVGQYEKGTRGLSVVMLCKIAVAAKVSPKDLLP